VSSRVGAVVAARMTSRRLPGKVLEPLAGRPAMVWVLERLEHAEQLDAVVVATSTEDSDDAVARFCAARGTDCHRGPLDDLAGRLIGAADEYELEAVVRISGDSPLLDQRLVDRGVRLWHDHGPDLVTNVRPRTFPPGQSVEVARTASLERAHRGDVTPEEREHVTGPLYDGAYVVVRFEADPPRTEPPMTLDTVEDHARLEALLLGMDRPHWDYRWDELS
jgi:spore coat polysaccharide biosynthesis protein SpsF (cytidylyltransferase family)